MIINLNSVGALTAGGAKVAHSFRPWEIQSIDGIDFMDSSLASVRYQLRGEQIMRILPRVNDDINGEWATDKGRYAPIDGVHVQEVKNSRINTKNGMEMVSLDTVFKVLEDKFKVLKGDSKPLIRIIYGGTTDCESIEERTSWCKKRNASLESITPVISNYNYNEELESGISFSNKESKFKPGNLINFYNNSLNENFIPNKDIKKVLLIGCDPRNQSPLLNLKLRELYLEGTEFWSIGGSLDLTFPVQHISLNYAGLNRLNDINSNLNDWDLVILGIDTFRRNDINVILKKLSENTSIKNKSIRICTTRANDAFIRNHDYSKTYNNFSKYDIQLIVNITEKEVDASGFSIENRLDNSKYNILLTSKGADWMKKVDVIIPICNQLEYEATYLSMTRIYRKSKVILNSNKSKVNSIQNIFKSLPLVSRHEQISSNSLHSKLSDHKDNKSVISFTTKEKLNTKDQLVPLLSSMVDYHLEGHPFAEYSATMARCSAVFNSKRSNFN